MIVFEQLVELWYKYKMGLCKKSTISLYRMVVEKHLLPVFGNYSRICSDDVQDFVFKKLSEGLSVKTLKDTVIILQGIVRFGSKTGVFPYLVWDIRYPSGSKSNLDMFTVEESRKLVSFCKDNFSFKNLGILICVFTGLRIGEVCALQWKDIDRERKLVRVTKTVERIYSGRHTEVIIDSPKSSSSCREIPLARIVMDYLRPFLKVMNPDNFVVSGLQKPLEPRLLRLHFNTVLKKCQVHEIKFHSLRHGFASKLIASGCDVKTVSILLGHASVRTTMDLYVHPDLEQKRMAVEKLGRKLQ